MKKNYIKPEIIFEKFSLSTNIASECEVDTNLASKEDLCGVYSDLEDFKDMIIFNTGSSCTMTPTGAEYDGVCYDVPLSSNNLFNS